MMDSRCSSCGQYDGKFYLALHLLDKVNDNVLCTDLHVSEKEKNRCAACRLEKQIAEFIQADNDTPSEQLSVSDDFIHPDDEEGECQKAKTQACSNSMDIRKLSESKDPSVQQLIRGFFMAVSDAGEAKEILRIVLPAIDDERARAIVKIFLGEQ